MPFLSVKKIAMYFTPTLSKLIYPRSLQTQIDSLVTEAREARPFSIIMLVLENKVAFFRYYVTTAVSNLLRVLETFRPVSLIRFLLVFEFLGISMLITAR